MSTCKWMAYNTDQKVLVKCVKFLPRAHFEMPDLLDMGPSMFWSTFLICPYLTFRFLAGTTRQRKVMGRVKLTKS